MRVTRRRERSGPVYVDTGEGVVSLVYEVAVTEARLGSSTTFKLSSPLAVHVIDDTGVQRIGVPSEGRPFLAITIAILLGPLQWVVFGRRRQHNG